jgi:hypothetical protein
MEIRKLDYPGIAIITKNYKIGIGFALLKKWLREPDTTFGTWIYSYSYRGTNFSKIQYRKQLTIIGLTFVIVKQRHHE